MTEFSLAQWWPAVRSVSSFHRRFSFVVYALTAQELVPRLFAAGLIPGLVLTALYMLVAVGITIARPSWAPVREGEDRPRGRLRDITSVWDVALLFGVTIGGLYAGWFTPMEAAAVGAFGALGLGALSGSLSWQGARESFRAAIGTTCMLFVIVIGAVISPTSWSRHSFRPCWSTGRALSISVRSA